MLLRPGSLALTVLLSLLTGLGPLSVDMYLASLPSIGRTLDAPPSQVQLTISAYLVGFAFAQVLYGPISDRHGRRPVLIAALGIYLVATIACALAPTIETLITARLVQAVGASGAIVLARAVVRDMFEGLSIGRELSRMAAIMAFAPLIAPLIGGTLETTIGWRSNFVMLLLIGSAATLAVWLLLPETLRERTPEPVSLGSMLASYRMFLRDRSFLLHLGIATCSFCGLFAWISSAPFVLQELYGLSALAFGVAFTVAATGYLTGATFAARFISRWGTSRIMGLGTVGMTISGIALVALSMAGSTSGAALVAAIAIYLIGMGMSLPQAQANALVPFPQRAGAASSLVGFVTQMFAAAVGALIGHLITTTAWPLAIAILLSGALSLAMWVLNRDVPMESHPAR